MNYVKHLNLFGVEAKEIPCITGNGAPTTSTAGAVGSLYMNTADGSMYKCTSVSGGIYNWEIANGTTNITYFGVPHESNVGEYYLNGGTDKILLFATDEGYDAVVTKVRESGGGTGGEDNGGESGGDTGGDGGEEGGDNTENGGEDINKKTLYYICTVPGKYDSPIGNSAFLKIEPIPFVEGMTLNPGSYYLVDGSLHLWNADGTMNPVTVMEFDSEKECKNGHYSYVVPSTYDTRGYAVTRSVSDSGYDVEKIFRLHIEAGVTSIPDNFMYKAYNLKHLSFEDSKQITHLGKYAFAYTQISGEYDFSGLQDTTIYNTFEACPKLEGLTFSNNVKAIAEKSFQFCLALRNVSGISNVTSIGKAAFQYCTSLETIFADYTKITFDNYAFLLTPDNASFAKVELGQNGAITNMYPVSDVLKNKDKFSCAQIFWTSEQLEAIRDVTGKSVSFPIPETDNQKTEFYENWGVVPQYFNGTWYENGQRASGSCGLFCLLHVYNITHPNSQYDTVYDFITREIAPRKLEFTQAMEDAFKEGNGPGIIENNKGVSYEKGKYVSALDLPMVLDDACTTWGKIGTTIWGICEVLGWTMTPHLFDDSVDRGGDIKEKVLDNIAVGKPVLMEIVGAAEHPETGVLGHNMHVVTAIGYDQATDKLKIVDSTWAYPSDIVPLVYDLPFEALITPHESSCIWTFNFGEVITMTDIDNKLGSLNVINSKLDQLIAGGGSGGANPYNFRIEKGTYVHQNDSINETSGVPVTVECSKGAKLFIFMASQSVYDAIEADGNQKIANNEGVTPWAYGFSGQGVSALWMSGGALRGRLSYSMEYAATTPHKVIVQDTTFRCWNDDTINGFKFNVKAIKAGEYNWTAYYWDE